MKKKYEAIDPHRPASYKQSWAVANLFAKQQIAHYPKFTEKQLTNLILGSIYYYHEEKGNSLTHGMVQEFLGRKQEFPLYYKKFLNDYLSGSKVRKTKDDHGRIKREKINKDESLLSYYNESKLSLSVISKLLKMKGKSAVSLRLKKLEKEGNLVKWRGVGSYNGKHFIGDPNDILDEYNNKKMSLIEIGKVHNISDASVVSRLKKLEKEGNVVNWRKGKIKAEPAERNPLQDAFEEDMLI